MEGGCATVSGTLRKAPELVEASIQEFKENKWKVLSPASGIVRSEISGFAAMKGDLVERIHWIADNNLPVVFRLIETGHLRAIRGSNVNWLVMPNGYVGLMTALEVGWSLAHGVSLYCSERDWLATNEPLVRAFVEPVPSISHLVKNVDVSQVVLPGKEVGKGIVEQAVDRLAQRGYVKDSRFNACVAAGPVYTFHEQGREPEVLLVETYKWGNRLSIPGGRLNIGERLEEGVLREGFAQTGLRGRIQGESLCMFNELPNAGYYVEGTDRIFGDFEVRADNLQVVLDHRASRAVRLPISETLKLPSSQLEPNARRPIMVLAERYGIKAA